MSNNSLEFADVIDALRENIIEAQKRGEIQSQARQAQGIAQNIGFKITNVDVELQTQITKEVDGGVKFRFWVVDADVKGTHTNSSTHKIKLSLQATKLKPDGTPNGDVFVNDTENW